MAHCQIVGWITRVESNLTRKDTKKKRIQFSLLANAMSGAFEAITEKEKFEIKQIVNPGFCSNEEMSWPSAFIPFLEMAKNKPKIG